MIPKQSYGDRRYDCASSPKRKLCNKKTIFVLVLIYIFCAIDCFCAYKYINYIGDRALCELYLSPNMLDIANAYTAYFLLFAAGNTIFSFFILDFFCKLEDGPHINIVSNSFWFYVVLSILLFIYYIFQSIFFLYDGSISCALPLLTGIGLFAIGSFKAIIF